MDKFLAFVFVAAVAFFTFGGQVDMKKETEADQYLQSVREGLSQAYGDLAKIAAGGEMTEAEFHRHMSKRLPQAFEDAAGIVSENDVKAYRGGWSQEKAYNRCLDLSEMFK